MEDFNNIELLQLRLKSFIEKCSKQYCLTCQKIQCLIKFMLRRVTAIITVSEGSPVVIRRQSRCRFKYTLLLFNIRGMIKKYEECFYQVPFGRTVNLKTGCFSAQLTKGLVLSLTDRVLYACRSNFYSSNNRYLLW